MWIWRQEQGTIERVGDPAPPVAGYSGAGQGKNNPDMQSVAEVGPIPVGAYAIGAPQDTVTHGPYVLTLTPHGCNTMFGRSGFMMHGDSVLAPGTASKGCIIESREQRQAVWNSGDHLLIVLPS